MSVLDRFLGELPALRARIAEESLTSVPEANRTGFGYGVAVGRLEGVRLAEEALNKLLNEPEEDRDRGAGRNRSKT